MFAWGLGAGINREEYDGTGRGLKLFAASEADTTLAKERTNGEITRGGVYGAGALLGPLLLLSHRQADG